MPELPEVETTRRGVAPHLTDKVVRKVVVRQCRLRWSVPRALESKLAGQRILGVGRRAKYLIFDFPQGNLLLHLGMSGSLRIMDPATPAGPHDHIDIVFDDHACLRFRDPRRFGSLHWTRGDPLAHKLLRGLGPEPLGDDFTGEHLRLAARGRSQAIKTFIMDSRIVVGVGNIYANEALFESGIHPKRKAGAVSLPRCQALASSIKEVLGKALAQGGTTLRDFVGGDGAPGYFKHELNVYDRDGQPCRLCLTTIRQIRQGQRSSYYCPRCQR